MRISDWSSDVCSSDLGSKPLFKIGAAKRILKQLIAVLGTCENLFYARDAGPRVRRNDLRQRQGLDVRVVNELLDEADLPCGFALDRHTAEQEARCLSVADERPQSCDVRRWIKDSERSEEHTSELQSLMRIAYAVFYWKKKKKH